MTDTRVVSNPYAPPTAQLEKAEAAREQAYLMPCSPLKLVVLSVATFNLYLLYWFWKNFRYEQRRNPEISVVLRTIFSGLFVYSLARGALDEAETRGISAGYSPALLAGMFVGLAILSWALPSGLDFVVFLMPLTLVPVQRTVNRINHDVDPALGKAGGFSGKEIALAVPGSLLVLLALVGTMLE